MSSADDGRRERFDALARDAYVPLRRYLARRTDASAVDDVLAETLLLLWRRLDAVPADAELAWAYGAARRCLANSRRSAVRRRSLLRRLAAEPSFWAEPAWTAPDPHGDDAELALAAAMATLPDTDREVLRLWAWEQLEPREMALVLDISANAASIRLHRATKKLRGLMGADGVGMGADGVRAEGREAGAGDVAVARKDDGVAGHPGSRQDGPRRDTETPR